MDNLASMVAEGQLWCDSQRISRSLTTTSIGHEHIKERRLKRPVPVSAGECLGDYVPFSFCPRSVMLYVIYAGGVAQYKGGQNPIVHLVSSIDLIEKTGRPWAFTDRHAELEYAQYFESTDDLDKIEWGAMPLQYWADSEQTKEKRQAEFLVHRRCPWSAIRQIGVKTEQTKQKVEDLLQDCDEVPDVILKPAWYY
jgi:ssDNA thymidine ADP-ribosyltransferase, DarT